MKKEDIQNFVSYLQNTTTVSAFEKYFDDVIVAKLKEAAKNANEDCCIELPTHFIEQQDVIEVYLINLFSETEMNYYWDLKENKVFLTFDWSGK